MEDVAFKLDSYKFTKVSLNLDVQPGALLAIKFSPHGVYSQKTVSMN